MIFQNWDFKSWISIALAWCFTKKSKANWKCCFILIFETNYF